LEDALQAKFEGVHFDISDICGCLCHKIKVGLTKNRWKRPKKIKIIWLGNICSHPPFFFWPYPNKSLEIIPNPDVDTIEVC